MALLVPDVGEVVLLNWMLKATGENQTLKLYESNTTPAEGDTAGTYTEATISGYAAATLTRASWGGASTSVGTTSSAYAQQTFTFTGTGTIYGYYVIAAVATTLLWSEKTFASGQTFNNGDTYKLTPYIELA